MSIAEHIASQAHALLRPEVLALSAYHVQDASGLVKLDAMENPYRWPEDMTEEWLGLLRTAAVNRYPDPAADRLRVALRRANAVPDGMELMLGNGSDELIQIILMALAGGASVLAPQPTFVMYRQIAVSLGLRFVGVDLRADDFSLDMDALHAAIAEHRPQVIFLAYPNNPTGNAFDAADVLEILRIAPGLVVLDEAYAPFADDTFMPKLAEFPNLLVMRTLSKLGLAGLRLGFLVGHPGWIGQLDKLRLPYNINVLTQLTAEFALSKQAVFDEQVAQIRRDREALTAGLRLLPVAAFPSQANFVSFRVLGQDADAVFGKLKQVGVLIKNLSHAAPMLRGCLRATVGTSEENQRFMEALTAILKP
ncbi:MAG: histidinol-phosphate transaminase [Candidatus Methylumidiphilus sp.]